MLNALDAFEEMVLPDHIFIGGGNAKRLDPDTIGPNRTIVPNISGLLGGIALWERAEGAPRSATWRRRFRSAHLTPVHHGRMSPVADTDAR